MHEKKMQEIPLPSTSALHQLPDELKNRLLVTPVEAGACFGWAKQTVYNKLNDDAFPIPLVELNGRKMVKISVLIEFINRLPNVKRATPKPKRTEKFETIHGRSEVNGGAL